MAPAFYADVYFHAWIFARTSGLSAWIGYTDLDQDTHYKWSDDTQAGMLPAVFVLGCIRVGLERETKSEPPIFLCSPFQDKPIQPCPG